jgi:ribulose-phosphate 3-epimerase
MRPEIKISASILAANPVRLEEEIKRIEGAAIDLIHIDVMDGHFVPNITMGPFIVKGIKKITRVPLDIHLMISHPEFYVKDFADAAGEDDFITFHIETTRMPEAIISFIKSRGLKAGVSLNPLTPVKSIERLIESLDMALVMSVNPGFEGQKFIPEVLPKIAALRNASPDKLEIEVDGGINTETITQTVRQGANVIVAATAIFKADDPCAAIRTLRQKAKDATKK